ncbi:MAG: hypothetical protein OEY30_03535 [Candidatus Bathyarchaeota archaeon]|nr:hypothetical protein [Candidatus Bathyarchaeota archaeon]
MEDRQQRKNSPDSAEIDQPERFLLTEPEPIEIASGYSISVKYDKDGRPLIYVKKYGDVDTRGLRREIERSYPGAHIQGLEKPQTIEINEKEKRKPRKHNTRNREKRSL